MKSLQGKVCDMSQGSTAVILLAGLLGLLEFLEFLTSSVGCAAMLGLALFWGCQFVFDLHLTISALLAGLISTQLYLWLQLE